ncbi:DUF4272 domain-containing protein [Corynebacterium breve]|uniref:DUF4272 domain-containing protein n=1 Tax=Corynebacterium breve TaxID=3049799 RepID=A0ABY8VCR6_9CORY|nr:DUF4272 domain-containing protein [Corynebacterium breve]WIM67455.1 DUF4272 domain-containing protein [Corynebacterium breve]
MHVTALSTVPPADPRFSRCAPERVAELIGMLADAGLTVTSPNISTTHPLARLVTRVAAIYEYERSNAYTASQLAEFSSLADEGPVVFQIGNGPLRNVDGENLQAPGMEVKLPVAADAYRRRYSSISALSQQGLDVDSSVPPVIGAAEAVLRPAGEIERMQRAHATVGHIAAELALGEAPETDDVVAVDRALLTVREKQFLQDVGSLLVPGRKFEMSEALQERAWLHLESVAAAEALAWAIGNAEVPEGRLRAISCEPVAWMMGAPATGNAVVRSLEDILDAFDLNHLVHHSAPDWVGSEGARMAAGWNRALGWALWPKGEWGQSERVI